MLIWVDETQRDLKENAFTALFSQTKDGPVRASANRVLPNDR